MASANSERPGLRSKEMPDNNFFKQFIRIEKPSPVVYQALTGASELTHWFPSKAESDPRPGGTFRLTFEFENAKENGMLDEKFVEVVPNRLVSYTWTAGFGPTPTVVTFRLTAAGGVTTVELDHSTVPDGADRATLHEGHAPQWTFYMNNLKGYLEKEVDQRKAMLKQITY